VTGNAPCRAQHQARARMAGYHLQDLAGLFRGQARIALQQTCGVGQRDLERSNRLRRFIQFQILPVAAACD
jgi:hypothetical protein